MQQRHGGKVQQIRYPAWCGRRGHARVDVVTVLVAESAEGCEAVGCARAVARVDVGHEAGQGEGVIDRGVGLWAARAVFGGAPGVVYVSELGLQKQVFRW